MKLAYFTNTYPRATDTFIRSEVLGLRKRGLDVKTYSVRKTDSSHDVDQDVISEKQKTQYLLPASISSIFEAISFFLIKKPLPLLKTYIFAVQSSRPGIKGQLLQHVYFLESLLLAKVMLKDQIEHVHNHLGDNSGTVTMLASKISNIPYSISIHGPHIFFDGLHWALDKKTHHSKFISCIGHYCKSQMMLYSDKNDWDKFKIIRCGIDLNKFEFRLPENKPSKLVYVGRLSAEKGLPVLFDSLEKLKKENYELELTVLGDGEDRKYLENLCAERNITDIVKFKGFVSQATIAQVLKDSDIFVLPSFAEGIPVALMEAMAIGLPVITTYVGGIAELVIDGKTGKMVYPSDHEGLANAIKSYIDNKDEYIEIAKSAREKIINDFEIESQIDKLEQLFIND